MKLNLLLFLQLLPTIRNISGSSCQQDWLSAHKTLVSSIRVSQGSVATRLKCDGIFNDSFIAKELSAECASKNYNNALKIHKAIQLA